MDRLLRNLIWKTYSHLYYFQEKNTVAPEIISSDSESEVSPITKRKVPESFISFQSKQIKPEKADSAVYYFNGQPQNESTPLLHINNINTDIYHPGSKSRISGSSYFIPISQNEVIDIEDD